MSRLVVLDTSALVQNFMASVSKMTVTEYSIPDVMENTINAVSYLMDFDTNLDSVLQHYDVVIGNLGYEYAGSQYDITPAQQEVLDNNSAIFTEAVATLAHQMVELFKQCRMYDSQGLLDFGYSTMVGNDVVVEDYRNQN